MGQRRRQRKDDPIHGAVDGNAAANPRPAPGGRAIPIAPGNGLQRAPKTAETVARALVRDIVRQGRQPGAALASENEMLQEYSTSRESLREPLRLLEVQGLVSIRRGPGGGPSVCTVDPANLGRMSALYYHMAGATYRELLEAWVVSQSILAHRAAHDPRALGRDFDKDHRSIAVAIVVGAPESAAALMQEHIDGIGRVAAEHLGTRLDDLVEWH